MDVFSSLAICVLLLAVTASGQTDCAQRFFDQSTTKAGKVFCGPGYWACTDDACCSRVDVSVGELAGIILGSVSVVCVSVLIVFMAVMCCIVRRGDKDSGPSGNGIFRSNKIASK
ncbi:hypothetical protein CHS0354_021417 [Potamilus streckersoni]|uniref:Transmembrane protein n=1 Tax=Potamilus streckersoni TaxID=2493646 RepID=A0AAE0S236_9BIVA|nr:hypothetical protein CHS0354_021417 [Potamilus streckersoni]